MWTSKTASGPKFNMADPTVRKTVEQLKSEWTAEKRSFTRLANSIIRTLNGMSEDQLQDSFNKLSMRADKVMETNDEVMAEVIAVKEAELKDEESEESVELTEQQKADIAKTTNECDLKLKEVGELIRDMLWKKFGDELCTAVELAEAECERVARVCPDGNHEAYEFMLSHLKSMVETAKGAHCKWQQWVPVEDQREFRMRLRGIERQATSLVSRKAEFIMARRQEDTRRLQYFPNGANDSRERERERSVAKESNTLQSRLQTTSTPAVQTPAVDRMASGTSASIEGSIEVQTFMTKTKRPRTALKALFGGEDQNLPDVMLMLVGGAQDQRSRAGDVILQETVFTETQSKEYKTQTKLTECVRQQRRVADRNVSVVNCPDWSTTPPSQKIKDVLLHGVTHCSPGPHAVLVTVDARSSFSEADRRSVEEHMELLGDRVWRHTLVLFTEACWLGVRRVEESEGEPLRWLLGKCDYRYHVLDGIKWDISEVTELMEKIEDMVLMNRGHFEHPGQMTLFERLKGQKIGEELGELMDRLKFVVPEPEEPTLPADWPPPGMSGGTPSETGSLNSWVLDKKVSDWLNLYPAPSTGYETMSEAPESDLYSLSEEEEEEVEEGEEEEEEDENSEAWMKMIEIESEEEEMKKTKHVQQSNSNKRITPEKLSRGRFKAQLEDEGTYECPFTGLIFETTVPVLVRYSGPIFNVHAVDKEASALKSIQLPHSLRLAGPENERVFGVLHVTGKHPIIDRVKSSCSHLQSQVSTLSPVGSNARDTQQVEHHGAVLVYEDLWSSIDSHAFRIYLALNSRSSHITEIEEELEVQKGRYRRLHKNPLCLLVERKYRLTSEPRGTIHPEYLIFTQEPIVNKGYFEASYEQPPPFTFDLELSSTGVTTWSTNIQQYELVEGITEKKPSKQQLLRGWSQSGSSKSNASGEKELTPEMKATFVKNNTRHLVQGVTEILQITDYLRDKRVFTNETNNEIKGEKTQQAQIRKLLDILFRKGTKAMSEFYNALQEYESYLLGDLAERPGQFILH